MLVQSTEMVFVGGTRLRVDEGTGLTKPFNLELAEGKALPKYLRAVVEGEAPAKVAKPAIPPGQSTAPPKKGEPTKRELMAQLSAAGIKFNATLSAAKLQELLDAEKKKVAPAASTAPPKEPAAPEGGKSVGDQDVI